MTLQQLAKRIRNRRRSIAEKPTRLEAKNHTRSLNVECLESRLVPYALNGGIWPHPELVTVSFMPDGTDIGGMPSSLFSTLNARFPTATWQKEILEAAQSYASNANINFSVAADDGSAFGSCGGSGSDCNLQGDSNFGDIRIGGFDLSGPLGLAMLPPPLNGDTTAGDFFLSSTATWNIGASVDLYTVSAHEAGHSVGLDHSLNSTAVMYDIYNGVKSSLTADDIAGIQAIYGARPHDSFDAASPNNVKADATVITSYIDSNKHVTLNGLDVTTTTDVDWYKITIPSGHSGTMVVQVQSSGLSLLAPKLTVYKGNTLKGTVSGGYNSTISLPNSIGNGQNWFIKVEAAESTVFGTGKYALQINMGTAPLPPVSIPNTATPVSGEGGYGSPIGTTAHDHDHPAHDHDQSPIDAGDHSSRTVDTASASDTQDSDSKQERKEHKHKNKHDRNGLSIDSHVTGTARQTGRTAERMTAAVDELLAADLGDHVLPAIRWAR